MKYLSIILFAFSVSAFAAEEYVCHYEDERRLISVVYENDQEPVPCEVQYDKGQGVQSLWNAQAEAGYCENKAAEFVAKQEEWGWSCEKVQPATTAENVHTEMF